MKWVFSLVIFATIFYGVSSCETNDVKGNANAAEQNLDSLISAHPDSVPLLLKRGQKRFEDYDYDLAMQDAAKAYRLQKSNPQAQLLYAEVINNLAGRTPEQVKSAQDIYKKVLKKDSKNLRALVGIAATYTYQQDFEKSFDYINKALRIDRHYRNAYVLKGNNFMQMNRKDQAISSYETAVQQDPTFYEAYFLLANIYEADGNRQCIEYFRNALELRPENREFRYRLAFAQQRFEEHEKAMSNYRILAKDSSDFYANRGLFHQGYIHQVEYQNIDSAIFYYNAALQKEPRHVESWCNLGICYDLKKDKTRALQSLAKALRYNPNFEYARNYADSIRLL